MTKRELPYIQAIAELSAKIQNEETQTCGHLLRSTQHELHVSPPFSLNF